MLRGVLVLSVKRLVKRLMQVEQDRAVNIQWWRFCKGKGSGKQLGAPTGDFGERRSSSGRDLGFLCKTLFAKRFFIKRLVKRLV